MHIMQQRDSPHFQCLIILFLAVINALLNPCPLGQEVLGISLESVNNKGTRGCYKSSPISSSTAEVSFLLIYILASEL